MPARGLPAWQAVRKQTAAYHYGTFYRSLPLPLGVEPDKIDARYRNGILELHLPKGEKGRGKRIAVNAA